MGLNDTPSANRVHIGFFGRRNAGKSSVVNAVTGQELAVVSDIRGTTTDPVYKSMELLPLGPVMIIDTPGFDDEGTLGEMRIRKTKQVLNKTDIAVLIVDGTVGLSDCDKELLELFKQKDINYLIVYNKSDLTGFQSDDNAVAVSAETGEGIHQLKERIAALSVKNAEDKHIVSDLIQPGDFVMLITPIDSAAPKGRLILPQQQTVRDIIDAGAYAVVTRETEFAQALHSLGTKPKMVITDSQAFALAAKETPNDILLTSFSILMARYKGFLDTAVKGAVAIDALKDGDTVLISEGCTHHRQCDDIGTVKLPRWLREYTQKNINIKTSSGTEFPENLSEFSLVIHCGGCMLTEREVKYRMKCAVDQNVPMTNYGTAIAYMKGILKRSLEVFPNLYKEV